MADTRVAEKPDATAVRQRAQQQMISGVAVILAVLIIAAVMFAMTGRLWLNFVGAFGGLGIGRLAWGFYRWRKAG